MSVLARRSRLAPRECAERFTLLAFHAHPDDEALLTGGTLAKAAAEGHRVILVTATAGGRGLAGEQDGRGAELARVRMHELRTAACALGCARLVMLGYADSGLRPDHADGEAFAHVDVDAAASRLAEILREEHVDVLTIYDGNGGYGHPDHVQVHRVGTRAAELAGTPVVLEATVPASAFRMVLRLLAGFGSALSRSAPLGTAEVFSPHGAITHRIRVGHQLEAKRAAMAAHGSQRRAKGQVRVLDRVLRLPRPLFAVAFGTEWFIEQGRPLGAMQRSVFSTTRSAVDSTAAGYPLGGSSSGGCTIGMPLEDRSDRCPAAPMRTGRYSA